MKIKILQENLLKTLVRTGRIISTKTQLPVLQNVLLKTENSLLRITATNLETTVSSLIPAKVEVEGGVCVSAKLFTELVTSLPQETIELGESDGVLSVMTQRTHAKIPTVAAAEFPPIAVAPEKGGVKIDAEALKKVLSTVLFAAATDEGRPLLTGVKIVQDKDGVLFVATDGYRLSLNRMGKGTIGAFDLVVPARTMSEVHKTLIEEKDAKSLSMYQLGEGQLGFAIGDTWVVTRLIDGEYPPFSKIIPKTYATRAKVDRESLLKAVKSVSIFARDNANIIKLSVEKGVIRASANTPQVGQNTVETDADIEGEGGEIAFNSRFLLDLLNNITTEELLFEMTGSLNPGVFKMPGDESFLHIIMPVRVQS